MNSVCKTCGMVNELLAAFCDQCGDAFNLPKVTSVSRQSLGGPDEYERLDMLQAMYYPVERSDTILDSRKGDSYPRFSERDRDRDRTSTLLSSSANGDALSTTSGASLLNRLKKLDNYPKSIAALSNLSGGGGELHDLQVHGDDTSHSASHSASASDTASVASRQVAVNGIVPRQIAEQVLMRHRPGSYLFRARADAAMGLCLAVRCDNGVAHYLIADNGRCGEFFLASGAQPQDTPTFASLKALIEHYHAHPVGTQRLSEAVDAFECQQEMELALEEASADIRRAIVNADDIVEVLSIQHVLESKLVASLGEEDIQELRQSLNEKRNLFSGGIPTSRWIPDSEASVCQSCQSTSFGTIRRRHHCRNCGRCIGSCCIEGSVSYENISLDKVCKTCYQKIKELLPALKPLSPSLLRRGSIDRS